MPLREKRARIQAASSPFGAVDEDSDVTVGGPDAVTTRNAKKALALKEKKLAKERTVVLKKVKVHAMEHKRRVEEIDKQFRSHIHSAFEHFHRTELSIDTELERYLAASVRDVKAMEKSLQNATCYHDKRHGKEASIALGDAYNKFLALLKIQSQLLDMSEDNGIAIDHTEQP